MAPPFDISEMMATQAPDDMDYEFGIPAGYKNQALRLSAQEAKAEDDAMAYLRSSLTASAEVTPLQGLATALLAAIPTLGGYMIGKSVGDPNIPEGVHIDMSKYQTGGADGGLMGVEVGAKSAGAMLAGLDADKKQANDVYTKMASIQQNRANRLDAQKQAIIQAGLNQQSEIDMLPMREASEMRINAASQARSLSNQLAIEEAKDARERLSPEDQAKLAVALGLDPNIQRTPAQQRVITNAIEAARRNEGQEFRHAQTAVPGYKNVSGAQLSTTTAAKLSEQNLGIAKTTELLDQYISMPDAFTGQESAVQGAVAGMLVNAQRMATNSGAQFSESEQALVRAALPRAKAGDLAGWIKQEALGRDQQVFAETLKGLYRKTQDYALLDAYGQIREDVPLSYYPPRLLQKWGLIEGGQQSQTRQAPAGYNPNDPGFAAWKQSRGR